MAFQETYAQAQKKNLMAEALAGKAMTPTQRPQGRIVADTGLADGLTTLMAALASRRTGKQGTALTAQADEQKRQAQAAALGGMAQPQQQNPYATAQTALDSGVDPRVAQSYMQQQFPEQGPPGQDPAKVQEFEFAKRNGYEGSFEEYLNSFYGREQNTPAALQEWAEVKGMSPEDRAAYLEMKRSVPIETINQVPTRVLPGGSQQPLSTLGSEADAKSQIAQAGAQGAANVTPADRRLDAQAKEPRLEAAARRLDRVADASERLGEGGGPVEGRLRNLVGTPAAQELEAANAQLINELTALTRVPGVGSQSDLEQRLAQLALPSATQHPEVRYRSIKELRAFIQDLDAAVRRVGESAPSGGGDARPQVDSIPPVNMDDPLGLRR
jgi:hypothetical protein